MVQIKNPLTIVQQGGGGGSTSDDVRFIDYDGTIVAQMSIAEAQALTALPEGPTHDGLEFKGWTHSLQEVKNTDHILDVGATYAYADDNNATVFMWTPNAGQSATFIINQDVADAVKVDWGDSSTPETSSTTGQVNLTHTFSTAGPVKTIITVLNDNAGVWISLGPGAIQDADLVIFGKITISSFSLTNAKALILSPNVIDFVASTGLSNFHGVETLIIPKAFTNRPSLSLSTVKTLVFPPSWVMGNSQNCYALTRLVLPDGQNSLFLQNAYSLKKLAIPNPAEGFSLPQQCLLGTWSLNKFTVPKECVNIGSRVFANTGISTLKFEKVSDMPTIDPRAVMPTSSIREFDFTDFTQVPTMNNGDPFTQLDPSTYKIYVPIALETAWKAAANWSNFANNIIGV